MTSKMLLVGFLAGSLAPPWTSGFPSQEKVAAGPIEVTPQTRAAIGKALDWLARRQVAAGFLPGPNPICSTSMACLAFLAEGSTPREGKYADHIRRGIRFIRSKVGRTGFITSDGSDGMYGHGYATLFLAEAMGMTSDPDEEMRDQLKRAVSLLEHTQNRFGGWNMAPDGMATDDGSGAIAIMQIMALRAARNAGVQVNHETIRRAKKYLQEMMSTDGWYAYNYNTRGSPDPSPARTGAGIYMFGAMDLYSDPRYEKGIHNVMNTAPFLGKQSHDSLNAWGAWQAFTAFYTSLAIYQHGGKEWKTWYPPLRDSLLKTQVADGSWANDPYGGLFTAFFVLSLELPYRYLPLFQEGGRGAEGN